MHTRKSLGWLFVAILCCVFGAGCFQSNSDDSSKLRAEIEAVRAELASVKAECDATKAELERIKGTINVQTISAGDRGKVSLASRFEAGAALVDVNQRQAALAKLAVDAAELGDAETTRKSIEQLVDVNQKQSVIYRSALRLAKADPAGVDAITLAKSLSDINQREKVMSKIAKGEYEDQ